MKCESCLYYIYDEEGDYYVCDIGLDEDEMSSFLTGHTQECPYYHLDDEYATVRKQM